jgi:threonine dehydratase
MAPEFAEIVAARRRLQGVLPPTPVVTHPRLSTLLGAECHVKLENTQPVGAFKIRGGLNLLMTASPRERALGYVTATRGNHGQSLAYACSRFASPCVLFVPRGNDRSKNLAMRALGADLREAGDNFDEAWAAAEAYAKEKGSQLVHPGREPKLVAGVGTWVLELLEQVEGPLDAVFVPVGVGSCIAGTATAIKALSPHTQVIGVQSEAAPAMTLAWRGEDPPQEPPRPTLADGLAVGQPVAETLSVMAELVDDMVLVSEADLARAIRWYATSLGQLAEGAGAAALAGAFNLRPRFKGGRIAVLLSGGNVDMTRLREVFGQPADH